MHFDSPSQGWVPKVTGSAPSSKRKYGHVSCSQLENTLDKVKLEKVHLNEKVEQAEQALCETEAQFEKILRQVCDFACCISSTSNH